MKRYDFCGSISEELRYVYSPICKVWKEFTVEEDGICNSFCSEIENWEYISLLTKEKFGGGTVVTTTCSFEHFGAPLIVLTDDIFQGENGMPTYGLHFEAVLYENGINIWRIVPNLGAPRPITTKKIACLEFPVEANTMHTLTVRIDAGRITATVGEKTVSVAHDEIPKRFHVGITACEGKNKFRELMIEEPCG